MTFRGDNSITSRTPRARRSGFTLIELMVVITIVAILASLVAVASLGFVGRAREAATRTTISKIDEAILERVSAINRWHERDPSRLTNDWEQRGWLARWRAYGLDPFAGTQSTGQGNADEARMVLSRKGMMMEAFPITPDELKQCYWFWAQFRDPGTLPQDRIMVINQVPVPYLSGAEQAEMNAFLLDINPDMPNNQSLNRPGEIFLYALKNAPVFGGLPMTGDEFQEDELIDVAERNVPGDAASPMLPDGDGVPELADAFNEGQPLRFYRWPTRLVNNGEFTIDPTTGQWLSSDWSDNAARITLMPNAPVKPPGATDVRDPLKQDPDDRAGYLSLINPLYGAPIAIFFHDMNTWHAPLVISAGPDGKLGLAEPDESLPLAGGAIQRYGMARPLSLDAPELTGETIDPLADEQLYDNISNHNIDGGL